MNPSELFLTRDVKDTQLIERCRAILDEWSDHIPFSPIKKLGSKAEFISAIEHATYKTKVTTQIEKRWLEDQEVPYQEQTLPANPVPKSSIDPWKLTFSPFADFSKHHRTQEMLETRRAYDCSTCRATGEVTCPECGGLGEVRCRDCNGYGHYQCPHCRGSGHIRKTRAIPRQVTCSYCRGKGNDCPWCYGKGSVIKDIEEEYYVPCADCASSGKIACHACRGHGKVTCGNCGGGGKVTCERCQGQKRLLSYTSVEVEEDPGSNDNQYISPSLPKFKKKDNPLSNVKGEIVFTQDENKQIAQFQFRSQPAASVLSKEVELCRATHTGHTLRQRIEIEGCVLLDYRYRYSTKEYSIFINPDHKLVEDLEGPIQSFIENTDAFAEKAFKERRYEDAYRLITRGLCMDEPSDAEKNLRDRTLYKILTCYRIIGLKTWLAAAIVWCLSISFLSNVHISYWFILGLIPLLFGMQVFAEDFGVRFSGAKDRILPGALFSVAAFLSGAAIGDGTSWTSWIGLVSLTVSIYVVGSIRSKARAMVKNIEAHFAIFPNPKALESYVLKFDPKHEFLSQTIYALVFLVALLSIQPLFYFLSIVGH